MTSEVPGQVLLATVIERTAACHAELQRYDKALALYERAVKLRERISGPGHPSLGEALTAMADVAAEKIMVGHVNDRDAEDVMALYERALQIKTRAYGREHPDVAYTLNSMANFYAEAGVVDAAKEPGPSPKLESITLNLTAKWKELYREALLIASDAFGYGHTAYLGIVHNVATLLTDLGEEA